MFLFVTARLENLLCPRKLENKIVVSSFGTSYHIYSRDAPSALQRQLTYTDKAEFILCVWENMQRCRAISFEAGPHACHHGMLHVTFLIIMWGSWKFTAVDVKNSTIKRSQIVFENFQMLISADSFQFHSIQL